MKKVVLFVAVLALLLTSCVNEKPSGTDDGMYSFVPESRTAEEQVIDKKLILLLREQIAGDVDVRNAEFVFMWAEEVEGVPCFVYRVTADEKAQLFAVATDESVIFKFNEKDDTFYEIYNVK